ncbi:MAG TPA: acyclic terpene utilization AtuA family protein, partial [Candidatus Polarisedimenticolaceae bacterium]|nr:acyclic terpene utilization AtuA family protein [Candidatus Polarisedimenticolaceae bacterium]
MSGSRRALRIANGQGFWGDSIDAPHRLIEEGPLDYLTLDYLAEVTMSIMQKARQRDPRAGYAPDFVELIRKTLPALRERGIRVVANAGGVNADGCRRALVEVAREQGAHGLRIGTVTGDDVLPRLDELIASGVSFANLDDGRPFAEVRDRVLSANVYISSFPGADALRQGAQIVVIGRSTDPGLVLAPLLAEYGWAADAWDLLAAGTIAGHILECGAQCTGGNYTDWRSIPNLAMVGYPLVEAAEDGSFVVTKHEGTGGLCTVDTVRHQLVYEMGDPRRYLTPDCVADFSSVRLVQQGPDRVRVEPVRGRPPTATYKVSISYLAGWKATGELTISGPDALEKARLCARIVWERLAYDGFHFGPEERLEEFLGAGVCHQGIPGGEAGDPPEVVLRLGVKGADRRKVE